MAFERARRSFTGPVPVATIAELRALDVSGAQSRDAVLVVDERVVCRWNPQTMGPDEADGYSVKPDSLTDAEPGRWNYDRDLDYPVNPTLVRVLNIEANNGGSVWPTSEASLASGTIKVPPTIVEGTGIARLALRGKFTTTGTRLAAVRLEVDGVTSVLDLLLESSVQDTTLYMAKSAKFALTPGDKPIALHGRGSAQFVGEVQVEVELYSIRL